MTLRPRLGPGRARMPWHDTQGLGYGVSGAARGRWGDGEVIARWIAAI
jgi:hypothetical protein